MTGETGNSGRLEGELPPALARLEAILIEACAGPGEWPAQIAAGIYAGVDFVIDNPASMRVELLDRIDEFSLYNGVVARFAKLIRLRAPVQGRLPGATDEALVASIVGLVGDHVRLDRLDRLAELRPELVLLTLLPYLGFADAQHWANRTQPS